MSMRPLPRAFISCVPRRSQCVAFAFCRSSLALPTPDPTGAMYTSYGTGGMYATHLITKREGRRLLERLVGIYLTFLEMHYIWRLVRDEVKI